MDPHTAFFIVSGGRRSTDRKARRVGPLFPSLGQAARALGFLRRHTPSSVSLHIEQGNPERDTRN